MVFQNITSSIFIHKTTKAMKKNLQCSFRVCHPLVLLLLLNCTPWESFAQDSENNVYARLDRDNSFPLAEAPISPSLTDVGIQEVFEFIEAQSDSHFVYDQSIITDNRTISLDVSGSSLNNMLGEISRQTNLQFKKINKLIYVKEVKEKEQLQPIKLLEIITGRVMDQNGSPIPGVSVLIKGTNTGTITDQGGNFSLDV